MTLWLTLIQPDTRHRDARRDLTSAVGMHHRLMMLFPDGLGPAARQELGVLFRVEEPPAGTPGGARVLLQSRTRPDLDRLPAAYGKAVTKDISPLPEQLAAGRGVRYRIDANAVRKPGHTTRQATGAKAVVPLTGADAEAWWARQAEERTGLKLTSLHSTPLTAARGERGQDKRQVKHARTRFDGTAVITDPDLLRTRLLEGIGRGKAYGCGLLSLAPATPQTR
ncbi:type I-E CRISPR-associated protein Cas6/Cse3/CasE [Streptomyces sp. NPDC059506]|uniref:type I-E CRISPR-associated protein Cas6/Cse3/CasE n=1 Tax=Streptomyces sp. NPDC059506 TaxID=3347751 RepID=UPI0036BF72B0